MLLRILLIFLFTVSYAKACYQRIIDGDPNKIVCVCNATHCDEIEGLGAIPTGWAIVYTSDISGKRMERTVVKMGPLDANKTDKMIISYNTSQLYQERKLKLWILGFGGAFTDSVGLNLEKLSEAMKELLLKQYFGPTGIEYTIGRIPMASTDFGERIYSYADKEEDFDLESFALQEEDLKLKIPFIKRAIELQKSTGGLRFFASPWSAPAWMKTNGKMQGAGRLKGKEGGPYYDTWANYFVKFLDAYAREGIPIWAVTVQNEPTTGNKILWKWQTMYFSPEMMRNFIKYNLGPTLRNSTVGKDVEIIMLDDNRYLLPKWADIILKDDYVNSVTGGIGVHWYEDFLFSASALSSTHARHPQQFLLATEACNGYTPIKRGVRLGDWERAQWYGHSVIEDLNNFVGGWTDWNLALNLEGGPTWVSNFVDAPIIINASGGEFYKQPMYYALAHFSKFIKPGDYRMQIEMPVVLQRQLEVLGVLSRSGKKIVVAYNKNGNAVPFAISTGEDSFINIDAPPHSFVTVIWDYKKATKIRG